MGTCTPPPNNEGLISLSMGVVVEREMIDAADMVILEVNPLMPWTEGDTVIPMSKVDYFVENPAPTHHNTSSRAQRSRGANWATYCPLY